MQVRERRHGPVLSRRGARLGPQQRRDEEAAGDAALQGQRQRHRPLRRQGGQPRGAGRQRQQQQLKLQEEGLLAEAEAAEEQSQGGAAQGAGGAPPRGQAGAHLSGAVRQHVPVHATGKPQKYMLYYCTMYWVTEKWAEWATLASMADFANFSVSCATILSTHPVVAQ